MPNYDEPIWNSKDEVVTPHPEEIPGNGRNYEITTELR